MNPKSLLVPSALGIMMLGAASCGTDLSPPAASFEVPPDDGIPELSMPLTPLATDCTFATDTKIMTVTVESGETALISKRVIDSAMLVNGYPCDSATSTVLKRLNVVEAATTGSETVIIDFINGAFASGSSTQVGINVDLGVGAADALKLRGSTATDRISLGTLGISTGTDAYLDIAYANVDDLVFSLSAGNDVFTGQGGSGSGTAYVSAILAYGGDGNDDMTGGTSDDVLNGGAGDDKLRGADGDDTLNGDDGTDTFDDGSAANGGDTFNGGNGTDTVDYSLRSADLTVTIGAGANDGDGAATENDDVASDVEGVKGGSGADTLTGDGNANVLSGGAGNDALDGAGGTDTLNGDDGDDTLTGGAGNDTISGGAGNDTIDEETSTNGADVLGCGLGTDLVDYSGRTLDLTITMSAGANDGEDTEGDDVRTDCEDITGGSGNDEITGNSLANDIDGGSGDDTLVGGTGNDTFPQGSADDGSDAISGGLGTDTVDYFFFGSYLLCRRDHGRCGSR